MNCWLVWCYNVNIVAKEDISMKKGFWSKATVSAAALAMIFGLAGCGQKSSSNHSSSSQRTTQSASAKAYTRANELIADGKYGQALDCLDEVDEPNKNVENLSTDLENYISAQRQYRQHHYQQASTKLSTMHSHSKPMRKAFKTLRVKLTKAMEISNSSNSSSSTTGQSNGQTNSQNQTAANAKAASQTSESVIGDFANKAGYNKEGYGIMPISRNGNVYRFEVRQSNPDNTVANLIGIFDYNSSTGTYTKVG